MSVTWLYAVALLVLGFVLILLEIFVIPGLNIFGILGLATVCVGVGYAYLELGFWPAAAVAGMGLAGTGVLLGVVLRAGAWRRLVLRSATRRSQGYSAAGPELQSLMGRRGESLSPLRPAGRVQFGDRTVSVVSEGGFVDPGAVVTVVRVAGSKVVVQPVEGTTSAG